MKRGALLAVWRMWRCTNWRFKPNDNAADAPGPTPGCISVSVSRSGSGSGFGSVPVTGTYTEPWCQAGGNRSGSESCNCARGRRP